ncbi:hypothetical protein ABPG72_003339 [Tetrahymena utriculariae]
MDDSLSIKSVNSKNQHLLKKLSLQTFQKSKQNLIIDNKDNDNNLSNNNISFIPLIKENSFLMGNNDEYSELNSHRQNFVYRQDDQFELRTDNLEYKQIHLKGNQQNNQDTQMILKDLELAHEHKENNYFNEELKTNYKQIESVSELNNSFNIQNKFDSLYENNQPLQVEHQEDKRNQNSDLEENNGAKKTQKKRKRHEVLSDPNFEDLTKLDFELNPIQQEQSTNEKKTKEEEEDNPNCKQNQVFFDYEMFYRQKEILQLITKKNIQVKNLKIKKFVDFCFSFLPFEMGKIQLEGNINLLSDFMTGVIIPYILILNHYEANKLLPVLDKMNKNKYLQYCYNKNVDLKQYYNIVNDHILIRMCKELQWRICIFNTLVIFLLIVLFIYRMTVLIFNYSDFQEFTDGNLKYPYTGLDKSCIAIQIIFLVFITVLLAFSIKGLLFYIKKHIRLALALYAISFFFNMLAFCLTLALFQKSRPKNWRLSSSAQNHQIAIFCFNTFSIILGIITTQYTLIYCKRIECFLQIRQTKELLD